VPNATLKPSEAADECYRCGYNLTGIANDQACPECGLLAERSRRVTDELHDTRPQWLRKLGIGVIFMICAIVGWMLAPWVAAVFVALLTAMTVGMLMTPRFWYWWLIPFAPAIAATIAFGIGVLLVTAPEQYPPADAKDRDLRLALRFTALAPLLAMIAFAIGLRIAFSTSGHTSAANFVPALALATIGCAPLPWLLFERLRGLAKRARSAHLAEHCRIVGIGSAISLVYIFVASIVCWNGDQWFGERWSTRSPVPIILLGLLIAAAFFWFFWSVYLLSRFALAFGSAGRALRQQWRSADRASHSEPFAQ
jgi:MFS family permease